MRLKRYSLGHDITNGFDFFNFTAVVPIKVLNITSDHPEGTSLFYLEEEYGMQQQVNGYIRREADSIPSGNQFVGAVHDKCIFLNETDLVNDTPMNIIQALEEESYAGTANFCAIVQNIVKQIAEDGASYFGLDTLVSKLKKSILFECDADFKSNLGDSYQKIKAECEELRNKVKDLEKNTSLGLVKHLAKELQYEKEFVDEHPF